jgi:orotate phosphoribosyltransferase-like protein
MATPYSQDLRDRVLSAYDRGLPTQQIAETFQVSKAWARRLKQRRRFRESVRAEIEDAEIIINGDSLRIESLGCEIMHFRALDVAF